MARWTRRVGQFTLFLAVVGLLTAVIFWRQLNVMQGQLDVMAADQRPWVSFEDFGIAGSLSFDDIGSTGGKRWHVKVRYQLKNYGKTPAAHVAGWAHILPIVSHHQIEGKWHGTFVGDATLGACSWTELSTQISIDTGQVLFPGVNYPPTGFKYSDANGVNEDFVDAKVGDGDKVFLLPICVTYTDASAKFRTIGEVARGGIPDVTVFGNEVYHTALGYRIGKKSGEPINLKGEIIEQEDLALGEELIALSQA